MSRKKRFKKIMVMKGKQKTKKISKRNKIKQDETKSNKTKQRRIKTIPFKKMVFLLDIQRVLIYCKGYAGS